MRLLVLLLLSLCSLASLPAVGWSEYQVPGAVIFVQPGQETLARQMGKMTREELPRLANTVGVRTPGPFPIFAYSNYPDFLRATGVDPKLLGVSIAPTGKILMDVRGDVLTVRRTLAHELTHSLLDQRLGNHIGELPTWVNEGIAGHLSDPVTPQQLPAVSQMIHQNGVLTLAALDDAFSPNGARDAAYLQSRSMIAWLEYRHPGALRRLIDALAAGRTFETALYSAAHLTPEQWWSQWEEQIPAYIYWLTFLSTSLSSSVIFAPLALLVVLLAILRARRKHAESEEEPTMGAGKVEERRGGKNTYAYGDDELLEDQ